MAARYVNPQNVAAQGQSFYTGLLPGSYDQGGGGRGNQSNVYGAGSGGSGGGIPDRTASDARSISDYKPKLTIDMRSRTGDKFKDWLKGPPEPTLVKLDGEVDPVQQAHAGAVHQAQQANPTATAATAQAHSSAVQQAQQATSGSQALVPHVLFGSNPVTNPSATRSATRPNISLNPGPAYQSGSKGFTRQPGRTITGLGGGSLQLPFPGMGKPSDRTQTRPNILMKDDRI